MEPVPLQDVERIKAAGGFTVLQGPELRTIFLGMDQKRDELLFSSVKGKNPFRTCACAALLPGDRRGDDQGPRDARRGPAGRRDGRAAVRGFQPDMNKRRRTTSGGQKLLAEAGYRTASK
jgi:peptide/nickel transport system substrate-binding protein